MNLVLSHTYIHSQVQQTIKYTPQLPLSFSPPLLPPVNPANHPFALSNLSLNHSQKFFSSSVIPLSSETTGLSTGASSVGLTPIMCGGTSLGSAADDASIGEMEITSSTPTETGDGGTGEEGGRGVDGGEGGVGTDTGTGSLGSSGIVSGVWRPMGFRGKRRVPLLGRGSRPRESQRML
jgi:hypothetical protein